MANTDPATNPTAEEHSSLPAPLPTPPPPSPPPPPSAPSEKFFRYFQHEVTGATWETKRPHLPPGEQDPPELTDCGLPDLQGQIGRISARGTMGGERQDAIDHCLAAIARLSHEVQDASAYVPPYDQRTYAEAIKALHTKLQGVRETCAPRPRFAFKSKIGALFSAGKNGSAISLNDAAELADQQRLQAQAPDYISDVDHHHPTPVESNPSPKEPTRTMKTSAADNQPATLTITNHQNTHLILHPPASSPQSPSPASATISNIHQSLIDLSQHTSTSPTSPTALAQLTLKHITSSLIICGPVQAAAHVTDVRDSVLVVASRQFRMHESRNCDIYLHPNSRPILEDCEGVRVAPLPESFLSLGSGLGLGGEGEGPDNQWARVEDFKWLRAEPSPNWRVMGEAERISEDVWREIGEANGGKVEGVEELLKAVGVIGKLWKVVM